MNPMLDIERAFDDWLVDGPDTLPDAVLDRLAIAIDALPQRRGGWRRIERLSRHLLVAAAVALMVTVMLGLGFLLGSNVGSPAPTPVPAPPARALVGTDDLPLEPGTYVVDDPFPIRIRLTVPPGWQTYTVDRALAAVCIGARCELGLGFWMVGNLPVDGCRPDLGDLDPPVGSGVGDLATALAARPGYDVTGPFDTTLSGYSGRYLELVGRGIPDGGCSARITWAVGPHIHDSPHRQRDQIWVLDVEGTRLVISAFAMAEATDAERASLLELLESIRIEGS